MFCAKGVCIADFFCFLFIARKNICADAEIFVLIICAIVLEEKSVSLGNKTLFTGSLNKDSNGFSTFYKKKFFENVLRMKNSFYAKNGQNKQT